ncbi:MAG TPA: hypothetical protein VFE91_02195, partial [Nitrososphaerales archaeon]|nr:hypothetical protein [Nitrososphaerales archaeon]
MKDYRIARAWYVGLLVLTLGVGVMSLPGNEHLSPYLSLAFYAWVPGYSFLEATMRKIRMLEKVFLPLFFSIAFIAGVEAVDTTLLNYTRSSLRFVPTDPFEFGLIFSLTVVLQVFLTWRAFRPKLVSFPQPDA